MREKVVTSTVFVVLFIVGVFIIGSLFPQDDPSSTNPYTEEANIYIPPNVSVVDSFDAGGMSLATVSMVDYKQHASSPGSDNFMSIFVSRDY